MGDAAPPSKAAREQAALLDPGAVIDTLPEREKQRVQEMEGHLLEATTGYRAGRAL
ncbi:hypothetical protein [Actinomadura fibrosa]|uniref:hypothetical protein n=1 Tax=Actinomadura fibrosa TaxID=111802 RepID=UPI001A9546E5|nr:hypothetical protein [Actinomadura fibrosa]